MILEIIRSEIKKCGVSRYRIAKDTGIPESTLCRLMQGKGGLGVPTVDILCEYMGLKLIRKKTARKAK